MAGQGALHYASGDFTPRLNIFHVPRTRTLGLPFPEARSPNPGLRPDRNGAFPTGEGENMARPHPCGRYTKVLIWYTLVGLLGAQSWFYGVKAQAQEMY